MWTSSLAKGPIMCFTVTFYRYRMIMINGCIIFIRLAIICSHYGDVMIGTMASKIRVVYSTIYSGADQRKYQSFASLAFVQGTHRGPVNSPHKWPVTRKMFPFNDVIMQKSLCGLCCRVYINMLSRKTFALLQGKSWIERVTKFLFVPNNFQYAKHVSTSWHIDQANSLTRVLRVSNFLFYKPTLG